MGHHYNYEIQAWIEHGRVRGCAHPDRLRRSATGGALVCCAGFRYAGQTESAAVRAVRKARGRRTTFAGVEMRSGTHRGGWYFFSDRDVAALRAAVEEPR